MYKVILAAGVAAMAFATPAASQPGDRGGGKERKAQAQKSERGGGARAERGGQRAQGTQRAQGPQRAERAQGPQRAQRAERAQNRAAQRAQRSERAQDQRAQRAERAQSRAPAQRGERAQNQQVREQRAQRSERAQNQRQNQRVREQRAERTETPRVREQRAQIQRGQTQSERALERRFGQLERLPESRQVERMSEQRATRIDRIPDWQNRRLARLAETRVVPLRQWDELARGGVWLNGCPPGLAKKPVPCVPPGQVRNAVGQPLSAFRDRVTFSRVPERLRYVYADVDQYYYRYGNGHMYRVDRTGDIVRALMPLFGLGLTVGQQFPAAYSNSYLPTGLQPFYAADPYANYHYANGYVYQVDPRTGLIAGVDPLLGYGHGYGQMMPVTYSAYNVPYQYRSLYYDTPDQYYRYAPGAIYQVDAETSLITAVAALLTSGMTVGQPMPAGYGAYNVPYDYRTSYYDSPDAWHRYSNGHIYRIDPTTQLVTAIVASILA